MYLCLLTSSSPVGAMCLISLGNGIQKRKSFLPCLTRQPRRTTHASCTPTEQKPLRTVTFHSRHLLQKISLWNLWSSNLLVHELHLLFNRASTPPSSFSFLAASLFLYRSVYIFFSTAQYSPIFFILSLCVLSFFIPGVAFCSFM